MSIKKTAVLPEGKYLEALCKGLHINPDNRDGLSETLKSVIDKNLSNYEIQLLEEKYLHRMTISKIAYCHNALQNEIDERLRIIRRILSMALNK